MTTRIEIRHVAGSKANQIEQFQLDNLTELTIGRDPRSTIAFDPTRDDRVSRNHAVIRILKGDQLAFRISDLGSSNGTRVNGNRIDRETDLLPDDRIELGSGGPVIVFDVQPRPPHMVARTRIVEAQPMAQQAPTRIEPEVAMATSGARAVPPTMTVMPPTKVGVGRETVQRMLGAERQATSQKWMYTMAGVLVVVALIGGGLWYKTSADRRAALERAAEVEKTAEANVSRMQAQQAERDKQLEQAQADSARKLEAAAGAAPAEIIRKYGSSTVRIDVQWRVYDHDTSKPLFHKAIKGPNGERVPCYVKVAPGKYVRWLTTDDEERWNFPVGAEVQGTGFVVNEQGYILTNKHVVAGWMINFNQFSPYEKGAGVVFNIQEKSYKPLQQGKGFELTSKGEFEGLFNWQPDEGGIIFASREPIPIQSSKRAFSGRNEMLAVRFPGSRNSITAELVRESSDADIALIKISSPQPLSSVEIAKDDNVTVGGAVTVLGYPGSSVETIAVIKTLEGGELKNHVEKIPEPTVTPGNISRLSRALEQQGSVTVLGSMGEAYQLTAAATHGNSGGPVFDANGRVIAVFTYGGARETTTWAVPIHYGRALFEVQHQ